MAGVPIRRGAHRTLLRRVRRAGVDAVRRDADGPRRARSAHAATPRAHPTRDAGSRGGRGPGPGKVHPRARSPGGHGRRGRHLARATRAHAEKTAAVEDAVESRELLDIVDLGRFGDGSFDAVVCFGGPVSYALEVADRAVSNFLSVNTDDTWDERLMDIEVAACREPGALDGGTHILAAVERV